MPWNPELPFNELPPLPPPGFDLEPRSVLKAAIEARTTLATLAQAGQLLPNPNVLVHAVPLLEAQASSEIENIITTADELFKHVDSGGGDHATKEALRYRSALFAGVEAIQERPLSARTATMICSRLQGRDMDVRVTPGTRIANPATHEIVYAPPEGAEVIREKLADWERFVHRHDDLDPLVRMAVAHYQFEAIHPFHDGNGRTGRVINILMLIEAGLLNDPILYLSRSIIVRKNDYYRLLRAVTADGAWIEWIHYMLDVVRESAASTSRKIGSIRTCQEDIGERARAATPGGRDARFLAVLFEQPYCRIGTVVDRCDVSRQTASTWLHALVRAGLLQEVKIGRDLLFVNHEFLDVLTRAE
ncbi:Fic family protein [Actinobacteria bacterium YIM 96077]|uniref:Fic family protein n=1 Tax=Phytoactinopolyspora halophila TaxID=1981511 RepID=A0A329QJT9_9ACTN|nr:Fic/DOC family N-terminal domain-containing protein [Phytoactinopolyspora halophila]AYY12564.1 Fic family protein [Actinobacteria bacterium YIM 96077]RAW12533.1 Fic family protein [Phytoactinopolyspora halophila]